MMAENGVNEASENLKNASIANAVEEAEELKKKANDLFQSQDYEKAIEFYTAAIEKNDSVAAYYGNRSISYLRTECFGYALNDANRALELDKTYLKGYYRRAAANMALGKFKNALRDFEIVAKAKPRDKDAKQKFEECSKITRRLAFEKAIAVEDNGKKTFLASDVDDIAVDASYDGPHLRDKTVDEKFALALLDHFKAQSVAPKVRLPDLTTNQRVLRASADHGGRLRRRLFQVHRLRRHSRPILRPAQHLPAERVALVRKPLPFQRRLRRSRILLRRSHSHPFHL